MQEGLHAPEAQSKDAAAKKRGPMVQEIPAEGSMHLCCRHELESSTYLVVGNETLLLLGHDGALLLRPGHDALQGVADLLLADLLQIAPRRQYGRLVHQVLQVCPREACSRSACQLQKLFKVLGHMQQVLNTCTCDWRLRAKCHMLHQSQNIQGT